MVKDYFWECIDGQLLALTRAKSAADVTAILETARNPYGDPDIAGKVDGFFAGGGGDDDPSGPLYEAGWRTVWSEASYYWCMEAPNGDRITYVEGDIYAYDTRKGTT